MFRLQLLSHFRPQNSPKVEFLMYTAVVVKIFRNDVRISDRKSWKMYKGTSLSPDGTWVETGVFPLASKGLQMGVYFTHTTTIGAEFGQGLKWNVTGSTSRHDTFLSFLSFFFSTFCNGHSTENMFRIIFFDGGEWFWF